MRFVPGAVVGIDMTAALALAGALGINPMACAEFLPDIEGMTSNAGCLMRRLAVLVTVMISLTACATVCSDGRPLVVCPPVVEYSREFQARAATELALLPEGSAIVEMLSDFAVMREQSRGCLGMWPLNAQRHRQTSACIVIGLCHSVVTSIAVNRVAMTNYPENWIPERIPVLEAEVKADGRIACTIEGEIWGAGNNEHEALSNGRGKAWHHMRDTEFALRTRPATENAVAAVRRGELGGVVFDARLDSFATAAEVQEAEAKIDQVQRKWQSWFETRKRDWEQQHGPFRTKLLAQMAHAYAFGTDDDTVTIIEGVPKWKATRASVKERNALTAAIDFDVDDHPERLLRFRTALEQISQDVDERWPMSSYYINLSEDPHRAAEEVAICLGIRTHIDALNPPPRHKLKQIGEAIWGSEWISPLARELGISIRTAHRYAAGDSKVPDDIFNRLAPRIAQAKLELQGRLEVLARL